MISKGSVVMTARGQLFVALGRLYLDGAKKGWYGIGFNGERVADDNPRFVAMNVNAYIWCIQQ